MKRAALALITAGVTSVAAAIVAVAYPFGEPERVSRFGEYRGFSEPTYDGYQRRSAYLTLEDGTQLAYDLLLPTRSGVPAADALPALLVHTPYLRVLKVVDGGRILGADLFGLGWFERTFLWLRSKLSKDGHLLDQAFRVRWLGELIRHGYAVVAVERAGTGASTGSVHPSWEVAAREADQILSWIAAQPWSNGKIGMLGDSYEAMTQYAAASTGNPHLKAILPCSSSFDMYGALIYPGGIYNTGFTAPLPRALAVLESMVVPVDDDEGGTLLARILEDRSKRTLGKASGAAFEQAPLRDGRRAEGPMLWEEMSLYRLLDRINRSGVAVYNSSGWLDLFTRDGFLWHANLTLPRRLHVRPLHHLHMSQSGSDLDIGAEALRWFDYWLKGIDNGIMDEPPIHYYVMGAREEDAWRTSNSWPLPSQRLTPFYLAAGRTRSVSSVNDGALARRPPSAAEAADAYSVDYSATSGVQSRWNAIVGTGVYRDMRANDENALTYTTPPLENDLEVTGHPVAHLWIVTDAPDADLFVYLEEVDPEGSSTYVTEGNLRASHRVRSDAPFDNLGLPYQRSHASDLAPLTAGEPVELVFDLLPTSKLFATGHRIRFAITGADADNFDTPRRDPPPELRVLRSSTHASFVTLPIIPAIEDGS